jgi:hypothetical protein
LLLSPAEGDAKLLDAVCDGLSHGFWCLALCKADFPIQSSLDWI